MMRNTQNLMLLASLTLNFMFLCAGLFYTYRKGFKILDIPRQIFGNYPPEDYSLTEFYRRHASIYETCVKFHSKKQPIVFLGDSLNHNGPWNEFFPNKHVVNRGINGDDTLGVIKRLNSVIALSPKKIFLMIGTNDIYRKRGVDQIISNIETILDKLQVKTPSSKIYIESLTPVRGYPAHYVESVLKINANLKNIADKRGYPFIDLHTPLKDAHGELAEEYTIDGLHLNGKGYEVWVQIVKAFVSDD